MTTSGSETSWKPSLKIEKHATRGRAAFDADELVQVWMVHHLRIIGEAARLLTEQTKQKFKDIPWKAIVGMRHYIVHEYFKVDGDAVWTSVEKDLPKLKRSLLDVSAM